MTEQIMKILPVELPYENIRENEDLELHFALGYNCSIKDCAVAIEKANLVRCPTEEEMFKILYNERMMLRFGARSGEGKETDYDLRCIAKSLLALLRGEK